MTTRGDRGFRLPMEKYSDEKAEYTNWRYLQEYLNYIRKKDKFAATRGVALRGSPAEHQADYLADGVNDHTQIQAAIDSLPTAGGTIVIHEGTYDIASKVLFPSKRVVFQGIGAVTLNIDASSFIAFESTGNWILRNLIFTGHAVGSGSATVHHNVSGDYVFIIENCTFRNLSTRSVISMGHGDGYNGVFIGNTFRDILIGGGEVGNQQGVFSADDSAAGARNGHITGNVFHNIVNNSGGAQSNIVSGNGSQVQLVYGNHIDGLPPDPQDGIWFHNYINGAFDAGDHGTLDHHDLAGLTDDDHTQYLKEKASGGLASEVPEHDHSAAAEGSKTAFEELANAAGDVWYASAADTGARLAIGTAGQVLKVNSGATAPEWAAESAGGAAAFSEFLLIGA